MGPLHLRSGFVCDIRASTLHARATQLNVSSPPRFHLPVSLRLSLGSHCHVYPSRPRWCMPPSLACLHQERDPVARGPAASFGCAPATLGAAVVRDGGCMVGVFYCWLYYMAVFGWEDGHVTAMLSSRWSAWAQRGLGVGWDWDRIGIGLGSDWDRTGIGLGSDWELGLDC